MQCLVMFLNDPGLVSVMTQVLMQSLFFSDAAVTSNLHVKKNRENEKWCRQGKEQSRDYI